MAYVDFKISTIKKVEAIQLDNVVEVSAYMYRGHYEVIENVNTYVRDEKIEEVLIIFVPQEATELEINTELYELLLERKLTTDEVIAQCVF